MAEQTEQTGATDAQIEAAVDRATAGGWSPRPWALRPFLKNSANFLVPPDQCIVPRSFIAAVDAAIDEAEELDYSPPYIRIPLGKWHDVENARDTFREGPRSSEPPSTAHATTVAQLERQCSLTFAAMTDTIDGLIARIAALEAEIEVSS